MLHFARGWSRGSTLFTASERTSDLLPVDIVHDVKITTTTAISNAESLSSSLFPLVLTGMVWGYCNEEPFSVSPSNWVKKRRWIWSWDVCGLEFSQQSNLILAQNQFMPDSVRQGAEGPTASSRRTAGWNVCGKERRNQLVWKEEAEMKQWFSQSAQLQLNSAATSPSENPNLSVVENTDRNWNKLPPAHYVALGNREARQWQFCIIERKHAF